MPRYQLYRLLLDDGRVVTAAPLLYDSFAEADRAGEFWYDSLSAAGRAFGQGASWEVREVEQ